MVETWRLLGFGTFAGLFALLAYRPRYYAGVWELAIANKLFEIKPTNIQFVVRDTGIGVAEQELPYVFDRFYRSANARGYQGTGLGLSIAKWIIDEHNGNIQLESYPGQGTTMKITLPRA